MSLNWITLVTGAHSLACLLHIFKKNFLITKLSLHQLVIFKHSIRSVNQPLAIPRLIRIFLLLRLKIGLYLKVLACETDFLIDILILHMCGFCDHSGFPALMKFAIAHYYDSCHFIQDLLFKNHNITNEDNNIKQAKVLKV